MVGVVVVAAYSATLVSFLTVQGDDLPFDSLADIQRIGKHRLGIQKGSVLEEFFKVGSQAFLSILDFFSFSILRNVLDFLPFPYTVFLIFHFNGIAINYFS